MVAGPPLFRTTTCQVFIDFFDSCAPCSALFTAAIALTFGVPQLCWLHFGGFNGPASRLNSFRGMGPNWDVDSSESLQFLLGHVQVPEQLQQVLDTGIASISDFAYAYIDAQDLSDFVSKLPSSLWEQLRITDPDPSPAVARLRRALDMCKQPSTAMASPCLPGLRTALHFSFQCVGRARTPTPRCRGSATHAEHVQGKRYTRASIWTQMQRQAFVY